MDPVVEVFLQLERGKFQKDLVAALRSMGLGSIQVLGKKAKVKLEISALTTSLDDPTVLTVENLTVTVPEQARGKSVVWVAPDGAMTRQDPRQLEMQGIREVVSNEPDQGTVRPLPAARSVY